MSDRRPIALSVADTGGSPANARTKTQELVERDGVSVIIGPLAAVEALAIDDYIREKQLPIICVAAAEDITQRKPNPFLVRVTASAAQCAQPLADYAAHDLKMKRVALIGDDFAYGHEQNAGFQRVFEEAGGQVTIPSLDGAPVVVAIDGDALTVNGARVVVPNLGYAGLVAHIIDGAFLPGETVP